MLRTLYNLRPLGAWLAKNWAALAAGFAINDIATGITPAQKGQEAKEPESYIVRKMKQIFGASIPVWLYGIITVFLLYYIYRILDRFKK
jgi:hypothetical protein